MGVFGGYIQGGGHSPLSSLYGMAADHVLSFELVTPFGEFVTADSTTNTDLFWALRGGGGGTFGVVTSVTIKVYPDMPVTAASWQLSSALLGKDKFWAAAKAWFDRAIENADAGTYGYSILAPAGDNEFQLIMQPFFAPNKTATQLSSILASYFSKLTSLNIPFSPKISEYKSFYAAWQAEFPLEPQSNVNTAISSRLFPRANFATDDTRNTTFSVLRETVEAGNSLLAFNMRTSGTNPPDSAINPAFRTSVYHIIALHPLDLSPNTGTNILSQRQLFTTTTMAKWRVITPTSGSYVNEADRLEPDWQKNFWGSNYQRLLEIKQEVDPRGELWVSKGVGSEGWRVESADGGVEGGDENGKLCRVE